MSEYVTIFACSGFLVAAFVAGWSVGGFLSSSKPVERTIDYLIVGVSLLLVFTLYELIAWEPLPYRQ